MIREYERFSTAAMNAFVGPKTSLYLNNLQSRLTENGFRANFRVIQSNGGIATVQTCSQRAVGSDVGPAGGVIGGRAEGMLCGRNNLITVDIGGTSADNQHHSGRPYQDHERTRTPTSAVIQSWCR